MQYITYSRCVVCLVFTMREHVAVGHRFFFAVYRRLFVCQLPCWHACSKCVVELESSQNAACNNTQCGGNLCDCVFFIFFSFVFSLADIVEQSEYLFFVCAYVFVRAFRLIFREHA